jgi:hypothetical protein
MIPVRSAKRTAFNAFRLGDLCGEEDYLITQDTLAKLIETLPSGVSPILRGSGTNT